MITSPKIKPETIFVKDIVQKEKDLNLYNYKVLGVPIWRLVRFEIRCSLLKHKTGFEYKTTKNEINVIILIKNALKSFGAFVSLLIKNEKTESIVFAFPRLQKIGDKYMDKFTDPLIEKSNLNSNCKIFQRPQAGKHKNNRLNSDIIYRTDFIETASLLFQFLLFPIISIIFLSSINNLCKSAKSYFKLQKTSFFHISLRIGYFITSYSIYKLILKKVKPKRIFLVDREIFFPVILACKKQGITIFELQHGITHGDTPLYSGDFDPTIDPDFFLTFGEIWLGPQFSIPRDRMVNIGWAYQSIVKEFNSNQNEPENSILVISDPGISSKILKIVEDFTKKTDKFNFHIRLHPQESLNQKQLKLIANNDNIHIQDNSVESSISVLSYKTILGENSSVLYEALSYGKKVGRLNFGGLNTEVISSNVNDGFFYLNKEEDFEAFINSNVNIEENELIYSSFNREIVNKLIL